jgi:hypothetical protein
VGENGGRLAEVHTAHLKFRVMKRHKHLWEQVVCWDNLVAASGKAMLEKRSRSPAAAFFRDWEKEL